MVGIDLARPFQRERWPGAIAQQALAPAVGGLDAPEHEVRETNGAISRHGWWTIGRPCIAIEEIAPELLLLLRRVPEHSLG